MNTLNKKSDQLTLDDLESIAGNFLTIDLMTGSRFLSEKNGGFDSGLPSI